MSFVNTGAIRTEQIRNKMASLNREGRFFSGVLTRFKWNILNNQKETHYLPTPIQLNEIQMIERRLTTIQEELNQLQLDLNEATLLSYLRPNPRSRRGNMRMKKSRSRKSRTRK